MGVISRADGYKWVWEVEMDGGRVYQGTGMLLGVDHWLVEKPLSSELCTFLPYHSFTEAQKYLETFTTSTAMQ